MASSSTRPVGTSPILLRLPAEVRAHIYSHLKSDFITPCFSLDTSADCPLSEDDIAQVSGSYHGTLYNVLRTCRFIYKEFLPLVYKRVDYNDTDPSSLLDWICEIGSRNTALIKHIRLHPVSVDAWITSRLCDTHRIHFSPVWSQVANILSVANTQLDVLELAWVHSSITGPCHVWWRRTGPPHQRIDLSPSTRLQRRDRDDLNAKMSACRHKEIDGVSTFKALTLQDGCNSLWFCLYNTNNGSALFVARCLRSMFLEIPVPMLSDKFIC